MSDRAKAEGPSVNPAVQKKPARGRSPCGYPDALRVLSRDSTRTLALERFRANGGDRDRWTVSDWRAMADALTRVEDWLELDHPRWPDREQIATVRRALESRDA